MQSVHGHEVLRMMLEGNAPLTKGELLAAIEARFGDDCRFHTCSAEGMSAEELVDFLRSRGKFALEGDALRADAQLMCGHDDAHDHHDHAH